jgi:iron complex transport system substrate-binding protein
MSRRSGRGPRVSGFRRCAAVIGLALAAWLPIAASAQPSRVISVNLCTDQLLLALADPSAIASVTYLARDCTISAHCSAAAAIPINYGTAEELIAAAPDLVLAGHYTARPAVGIAHRLGLPIMELAPAASLDDVRNDIREVAAALGQAERGAAVIADLDRQLAAGASAPAQTRPVAAVYEANGMTVGAGSLIDAALAAAGFDNLARRLGLKDYMYLPLETLIAGRPDLLVLNTRRAIYPALAESILRHPAIAAAVAPERRMVVPQSLWICGGPEIAQAVTLLREARMRLETASP